MSAQDEHYLPKEPLDLPRERLDLPEEPKEIPAHASHHETHQQYHDVKTLLAWTAPGRPFRQRGKEFFVSSLLLLSLIEIILFLFSMYMEMLVAIAFVFLAFSLALVPPMNFHYKISTEGISVEDHFFLWQELYDFYFKRRHGLDVLHIRTHAFIPGELTITLGDIHTDQVKSILLRYLPYREMIQKTAIEKAADWLSTNFPLERSKKPSA